ncbi:ATP-binding protein [Crocosphaera sp. UHCC 0190]|uniref:ATP-binding protein n=1 Tax=Crocosphaera sp. UHCC 0190 TaxID=3110246 RepID=UPI002B200469|nr:ATP-binding protein [Crocosphaera sp. UHCC 0190]MEA5508911.1 ATP-binding protein [Crocosphaera sp. UHCC 0190]
MNQDLNYYYLIHQEIASLLLYQSIFEDEIGQAFLKLLNSIYNRVPDTINFNCLTAYSHWFKTLASQGISWQDYLVKRILVDNNPFSQQVQSDFLSNVPKSLIEATEHDLSILNTLYNLPLEAVSQWVKEAAKVPFSPFIVQFENKDNTFLHKQELWENCLEELANYYRQHGTGIFAQYKALQWQDNQLMGIANPDPIKLTEIVGYEAQKATLIKNTEILLSGYTALHVLLYGSRGSGKSSLVKGLLNQYSSQGLRLVEVNKSQLYNLPLIVDKLRNVPQKFIIFVDDLSFEEDDDSFKALKVVLEGSVTARAKNVIVYATSNRRHLIREFFDDRPRPSDADEIHNWDTVQEKLSFSDRFGLTLTFEPANQETYLKIVHHLATEANLNLPPEDLEFRAKQWATKHNGRSGRSARQFIDFLQGELGLKY